MRRAVVWVGRIASWIVIFGTAALVGVLVYLSWEHRRPVELPAPTGAFEVGRATFLWIDDAHVDELSPSGEKHQVAVWMWYPAAKSTGTAAADYMPPAWRAGLASHQAAFMRTLFKHDPAAVRAHSVADLPVAPDRSRYPVVLLRPGGSALTTDFTTLAEDLASHGYVVVGFDVPYRSFVTVLADGRVIGRLPAYNVENANGNMDDPLVAKLLAMWTIDTRFVADRLAELDVDRSSRFHGRLDLGRLGMFGHSFGGAASLQFCHEDPRCRAAVDMDGIPFGSVVRDGLAVPAMFLLSDHSREMSDPSTHQVLAEIESIDRRLPSGSLYAVIRTANHFTFSDQSLLNSQFAMGVLRVAGFPALDARRGLAISADLVRTFFDVHLSGANADTLQRAANRYAEVQQYRY
jgi:predicted dienelactone hydrolase